MMMPEYRFSYPSYDATQIRLIRFQSSDSAAASDLEGPPPQLLDCYLWNVPRDTAEYFALSYVWGKKEDTARIRLNDQEISVQKNLEAALRVLHKYQPSIWIWIDALCINQEDEDEKSKEVKQMKTIYQNALQVVAWLGPADETSDQVMAQMLEVSREWTSSFRKAGLPNVDRSVSLIAYLIGDEGRQRVEEGTKAYYYAHLKISDDAGADISKSGLKALLSRPWWRRVWIVQEFSLAKGIWFICGECIISLEQFLSVHEVLGMRRIGYTQRLSSLRLAADQAEYEFYDNLGRQATTMVRIRKAVQAQNPLMIENIMVEAFARERFDDEMESTDPRDRVYGLLGLVTQHAITVDYKNSTIQQVYTQMAEDALRGGCIDLLAYTQFPKKVEGLPSWAPDWTATSRHVIGDSIVRLQGLVSPLMTCPYSRGSALVSFETGSDGTRELHIKGSCLDKINQILPAWNEKTDAPLADESWPVILGRFASWIKHIEEACFHGCVLCTEPAHRPPKEELARSLCANHVLSNGVAVSLSSSEYVRCYDLLKKVGSWESDEESQHILTYEESQLILTYSRVIYAIHENRRMFSTFNGLLGVGPSDATRDDALYFLHGCQVPFVLRQIAPECFTFLGECYGDKIEVPDPKDNNWVNLRIR